MSSLFTLNSYARGDEEARNLLPDLDYFTDGALPVDASLTGAYADQWYVASSSLGSGGAYTAVIDTTFARTGDQSLRLSLSTAGAPDNSVQVMSPHIDVTPGETYLFAGWRGKTENITARSYFRIAGGSTDSLTEYPASTNANDIDGHVLYEDVDLTDIDTGSGPDATLMTRAATIATIPAGVTRAAIRVINWKPTSGSTHYWDDFAIYQLTGAEAYQGDTGWFQLTLVDTGNWTIGGGNTPSARIRDRVIYFRGNVQSFPSGSWFQYASLPLVLAPELDTRFPGAGGTATYFAHLISASTGAVSAYCSSTTTGYNGLGGIRYPLDD